MEEKEYNTKMRRFRRRLNIEAGIRAGTAGLAVGLATMAATLLYGRLRFQSILLQEAVIALSGLFFAVTLISYFVWFRPKKKEVLARIDSLGLKERIITMDELKGEDTVIAVKQRQDAKEHLERLDASYMGIKVYIRPLLVCLVLAMVAAVLALVPFPKEEVDPLAEQNAQEMQIVDEMILELKKIVSQGEINEQHKKDMNEILDALAMSFSPTDSTLTRTAKIATASKRLDMYEAAAKAEITVKKQQSDDSSEAKAEIKTMEAEQKQLSALVKSMKDIMGTSIDVLNKVEGTFWTPGGPTSENPAGEEQSPPEENPEENGEPQDGEEPGEGEEPQEGMEPGEGEPQEGMEGNMNGAGGQTIFDPELGEIGYGSVYEQYYQEILKALTELEFSREIRDFIENYSNSLE